MTTIQQFIGLILMGSVSLADAATLIENSPFIPSDRDFSAALEESAAINTVIDQQIEFKGYYKVDDTYYFLIGDKTSDRGEWIQYNGTSSGDGKFQIEQFDLESDRVKVKFNNTVGWIPLQTEVVFGKAPPAGSPQAQGASPRGTNIASIRPARARSGSLPARSPLASIQRPFASGRASPGNGNPEDILDSIAQPTALPRSAPRQNVENMDIPPPAADKSNFMSFIPGGKPPGEAPTGKPDSRPEPINEKLPF